MVDAKDKTAGASYRHHGFIALPETPMTLFLSLATVSKLTDKPQMSRFNQTLASASNLR